MNNQQHLQDIEDQLKGLDKISNKSTEIVKHGKSIIRNDSIEDKDESISSIKRVEEVLEAAIFDAVQFAKDTDQPKIYDSVAKLIKEFGALQTTKMNIHKAFSTKDEPTKGEDDDLDDTNQLGSITSIKDVLASVKEAKKELDKDV